MKKRVLSLMMAGLLLTAPATVFAEEPTGTSNTVYTAVSECSDGGYWITTIEEEDTGIAAFAASTKRLLRQRNITTKTTFFNGM